MAEKRFLKIIVSYHIHDTSVARQIIARLGEAGRIVRILEDKLEPPLKTAEERFRLDEELRSSDYYLILVSDSSIRSIMQNEDTIAAVWGQQLNIVPFVISSITVPPIFRPFYIIDGANSLNAGINALIAFIGKKSRIIKVPPPPAKPVTHQKPQALPDQQGKRRTRQAEQEFCLGILGDLPLGDLRRRLSNQLTLAEIRVLWFDVFHTKLEDDVSSQDRATCCIELLDRSTKQDLLPKVIESVCMNFPRIGREI